MYNTNANGTHLFTSFILAYINQFSRKFFVNWSPNFITHKLYGRFVILACLLTSQVTNIERPLATGQNVRSVPPMERPLATGQNVRSVPPNGASPHIHCSVPIVKLTLALSSSVLSVVIITAHSFPLIFANIIAPLSLVVIVLPSISSTSSL